MARFLCLQCLVEPNPRDSCHHPLNNIQGERPHLLIHGHVRQCQHPCVVVCLTSNAMPLCFVSRPQSPHDLKTSACVRRWHLPFAVLFFPLLASISVVFLPSISLSHLTSQILHDRILLTSTLIKPGLLRNSSNCSSTLR